MRAAEEPHADGDQVHERVLQRERLPPGIAQPHGRELRCRQLAQHVTELAFGACCMRLVETLLELLQRQAPGLVVLAELCRSPRAVGIGGEEIRRLGHGPIVVSS